MKNYHNVLELNSALEIEQLFHHYTDPNDLVLHYENDLTLDEFDEFGFATRCDDTVVIISSMKAFNAKNIDEFVYNYAIQSNLEYAPLQYNQLEYNYKEKPKGIIAIIGSESKRNHFGRIIPGDIKCLLNKAETRDPLCFLAWSKYECVCVISSHPEALH